MVSDKINEVCRNYTLATGISLRIVGSGGVVLCQTGTSEAFDCINKISEFTAASTDNYDRAVGFACNFGGRYIFLTDIGFMQFVIPVFSNGDFNSVILSEPVVVKEKDYFLETEIISKYHFTDGQKDEIQQLYKFVKEVEPERVHPLCETLYINVSYITGGNLLRNVLDIEDVPHGHKLQSIISNYIADIKKSEESRERGLYPLDKEDELLDAMTKGDKQAATKLLNQILGHIFFYSGFNIEIIRSRVVELMTLLSRAAVKGGADMELVLGMNFNYLNEVDKLSTIEDLASWLSVVMNRYMEYVFSFVAVKHVDAIYKAKQYVRLNYMNKITLEEVAAHIYLSPSYFSKIFKEETKHGFVEYLNNVRVEHGKKLLLTDDIELSDISNIVGFEDQSYFTRVFKKLTGVTPGKFRQKRGL